MKVRSTFFLFLLISCGLALSFCSCEDSENILPPNTGRYAEILIVADSATWAGSVGEKIRFLYSEPYPLLTKQEPYFKLIPFLPSQFSEILKTHRNIIIINAEEKQDNSIKIKENLWAQDQHLLVINIQNEDELLARIDKQKKDLFNYFYLADLERQAAYYRSNALDYFSSYIETTKGINIPIPKDFVTVSDSTDFFWLMRDKAHLSEHIFYYEEDYVSKEQLTLNHIIKTRNKLGKARIFGEIKDSYMSTETRFPDVFPLMDTISVSGQFGLRTRGWWKMENDFLGGYFIRYTLVDERRAKVVHVETALYCPKYDKMFYLRTLESVLNGIEFSTLN